MHAAIETACWELSETKAALWNISGDAQVISCGFSIAFRLLRGALEKIRKVDAGYSASDQISRWDAHN